MSQFKKGDRVRVVKDDPSILTGEYVGRVGVLSIDPNPKDSLPYYVDFGDADVPHRQWCVAEVEAVTEQKAHAEAAKK